MPSTTATPLPAGTSPEKPRNRESTATTLEHRGHTDVDVAQLPMTVVHARRPFLGGFSSDVRDIWSYRGLLAQLVRKELKVKYKDSVLGFFWTLVRPMIQLVIYYVAFTLFLGNTQPAYAIFIFSGLVVWGLFTDIVGGSTGSIVGNGGLLKKTYFPREIFPLSVVGASIVNFLFQLVVLLLALGLAAVTGHRVTPTWDLALVPLALVVCIVWATALGLFLAAATVYLRDLQHLIEVILLALFWLVPIVYAITLPLNAFAANGHQALLTAYLANPMLNVIAAFQRAFYTMGPEYMFQADLWPRLGVLLLVGAGLLWLAQRYFARVQGDFAQEL
ncbi:ABC transporter permease [Geodermatophilus marinus]|uniref:ABC transporter permease n=1 Tax=Geodermatophilus sp. LHW52908 TaxID=2303986 RepID=UPI000E3CB196|nr:ABC transporter permease [Geodermatophilus sp. LHW52908]RFU21761.1 ABC transporter permease [Geodermatophilus sp. LHW52908]